MNISVESCKAPIEAYLNVKVACFGWEYSRVWCFIKMLLLGWGFWGPIRSFAVTSLVSPDPLKLLFLWNLLSLKFA